MFQITVVVKIKRHILCSILFSENRAVYEIMSKNTVEPDRPQMAVQYTILWVAFELKNCARILFVRDSYFEAQSLNTVYLFHKYSS